MALSPIGGHCQRWLRGEWMEDEALLLMETENLRDLIKENLKIRTETGGGSKKKKTGKTARKCVDSGGQLHTDRTELNSVPDH